MSNEKRRRLQKWGIGFATTILIALLSAGGVLLVEIRDSIKYKQPQYDYIQDNKIDNLIYRCDNFSDFKEDQKKTNREILKEIMEISGDIERLEQKQDYTIKLINKEGSYYTTYTK